MWELFFLRSDALTALEDEMVRKVLPRYVGILKENLMPNFQILKRVEFEPRKNMSLEDMWDIHSSLMEEFYDLRNKLDESKVMLEDTRQPHFSLLDLKIHIAREIMHSCELCEWKCRVDRMKGELGVCRLGKDCLISSEFMHMGEESYFVPSHTIFFWSCNMGCVFCQNYLISARLEPGIPITPELLARAIEKRRKRGSRNVNFVGGEPTMYLLCILETLKRCDVNVPVLWNSNFFMSEKTMKLLDGVVDVYLSDFKYGNDACARRLTKVQKYWDIVTRNHSIAAKQAEITVRHLVLPNHVECCSFPVLEWISKNIKEKSIVNIMDQYYPCFKAVEYPEINRRVTNEEYERVLKKAEELNLNVKS